MYSVIGTNTSTPFGNYAHGNLSLLKETGPERQRCLEALLASPVSDSQATSPKAWRSPVSKPPATKARETQTDPVTVLVPGGSTPTGHPASQDQREDDEQEEAMRTLRRLGEQQSASRSEESRVQALEAELGVEKTARWEATAGQEDERRKREATQQQVICLEYELDGKEAALQVADRALDRRDADLQQAQLQLKMMAERLEAQRIAFSAALSQAQPQPYVIQQVPDGARFAALQATVLDHETRAKIKDGYIENLLSRLKQRGGGLEEDRSTVCGSERSAVTSSAASAYSHYSSLTR